MKVIPDGDSIAIVKDDFQDLQASEAVFLPLPDARTLSELDTLFAQERKYHQTKTKQFRQIVKELLDEANCSCKTDNCLHNRVLNYLRKLK